MQSDVTHKSWSIITVTFNSCAALRSSWASWCPHDEVEWIVVDNNSGDHSADIARGLGASQVIQLDRNLGFGAANNIGLRSASGRYVLFANPDLEVSTADLSLMGVHLDRHGGLAGPQLVWGDGASQPNGRGFPRLMNKVANRLTRSEHVRYRLFASPSTVRKVCFLMGAAICGARETFDDLGGWDEKFFVYYEDSDICMREWLRGGPVMLVGGVIWVHGWARETSHFSWRPWALELASAFRFYSRYPRLLGTERLARSSFPVIAASLDEAQLPMLLAQEEYDA